MLRSISTRMMQYIPESERSEPPDQQTVFWIVSRTPKQTSESAANYARARKESRRNRSDIDTAALNAADLAEWKATVKKIERFVVDPDAPEHAYDHFLQKMESATCPYEKREDGSILCREVTDESDLGYIYWVLDPTVSEEIISAALDMSKLRSGLKKG